MKWYELYKKIGNQNLKKMQKSDVVMVLDNKEVPLFLKFKVDGSPQLIPDFERIKPNKGR